MMIPVTVCIVSLSLSSPPPPPPTTTLPLSLLVCRCAIGYEGNNPKNSLILVGSGKGTVEDIREFCKDDNIVFGLFRVVSGNWVNNSTAVLNFYPLVLSNQKMTSALTICQSSHTLLLETFNLLYTYIYFNYFVYTKESVVTL